MEFHEFVEAVRPTFISGSSPAACACESCGATKVFRTILIRNPPKKGSSLGPMSAVHPPLQYSRYPHLYSSDEVIRSHPSTPRASKAYSHLRDFAAVLTATSYHARPSADH